jgi:hypothetical protein
MIFTRNKRRFGVMPFGFAKKIDKLKERDKVVAMLMQLMEGRQSAFVNAPPPIMRTKTLDEKCLEIVLRFFIEEKQGCVEMVFGSFSSMMQVMPELRRVPRDIDIQLSVGRQEAILIVSELFARLERIDKTLRVDPQKPTIIETNKNGRWERAVDIHYAGEPPEDALSPHGPPFEKERTKDQRLTDALDFYIFSKSCLVSAKMCNESNSIIERWESLLRRYVELCEDEIDFRKLEVKHKDGV